MAWMAWVAWNLEDLRGTGEVGCGATGCHVTREAARSSMEKDSESQGQGLFTSPGSPAASRLQAEQAFDSYNNGLEGQSSFDSTASVSANQRGAWRSRAMASLESQETHSFSDLMEALSGRRSSHVREEGSVMVPCSVPRNRARPIPD